MSFVGIGVGAGAGVGIGIDIGRTTHERPNTRRHRDYPHTHTTAEQRIYRTRASRRFFCFLLLIF